MKGRSQRRRGGRKDSKAKQQQQQQQQQSEFAPSLPQTSDQAHIDAVRSIAARLLTLGTELTEVQALAGARGLPGLISSCEERSKKNDSAVSRKRSTESASNCIMEICTAIRDNMPSSLPRNVPDARQFVKRMQETGIDNNQDPDAREFNRAVDARVQELNSIGSSDAATRTAIVWASKAGHLGSLNFKIFTNAQSIPFVRGEIARVGQQRFGRLLELTVSHPHVLGVWKLSNFFFASGRPQAIRLRDDFVRWCAGIIFISPDQAEPETADEMAALTTAAASVPDSDQSSSKSSQKRRKFSDSSASASANPGGSSSAGGASSVRKR
ncbi:Hypothetical Protein FCC1311_056672 [Hondaea fermentalgiana]|uniref:Uncharacterized protein n=1 Tax=Hondaea fermentalgiana TaxID=2315210 RepID=A0A2R5GEV4_9STRA|nr:Hypothetical Protein FCC1311_056672 [Hondaea fermentalgiana]|eukprot:GBG29446.1 Hypothetical Protein FCC1311_056672 [Hondaea fermentalgiana]